MLRFVGLTAVTVRGAHVIPRERLRVTPRAGSIERARAAQSSASGTVTLVFGVVPERDRCGVPIDISAPVGVPGRGDRRERARRGAARRRPLAVRVRCIRAQFFAATSVCTTWVVPGVTFEVMPATVLYVPAFLLDAS